MIRFNGKIICFMKTKLGFIIFILMLGSVQALYAQSFSDGDILLPAARKSGGKPLLDCLSERKTTRDFSEKEIDLQIISDLLWAAWGVNRPESGKRTAPSAVNWQEIELWLALKDNVYKYDAVSNKLVFKMTGDHRSAFGRQAFLGKVPLAIAYIADYSRMGDRSDEDKKMYASADAAFISQNIYLFCASEGMGTVVIGAVDRDKLAEVLKLGATQKVVFTQAVGYPK